MNTLATLCFALMTALGCYAQSATENTVPKGYDPKQQKWDNASQEPSTVTYKSKSMPVIQSTGKTYDSDAITKMARKDINGIASTTAGVESRPGSGEIPSIRGAGAAGTAYFVDGVRVYGALPIITK
jgi:hypothetical protein